MIQGDVFSQKKNWHFLAENMIEDCTAKQSELKFLVGRLPRMEPQEMFKRKKLDLSLTNMKYILRSYYWK